MLGPEPRKDGGHLFSYNGVVYCAKDIDGFQKVLSTDPKMTMASLLAAQHAARTAQDALGTALPRCCPSALPPAKVAEKPDVHAIVAQLLQTAHSADGLAEVHVRSSEKGRVDFTMEGNVYRASEATFGELLPLPRKPGSLADLRAEQRARAARRHQPSARWPSRPLAAASVATSPSLELALALAHVAEPRSRCAEGA